MKTRPLIVYFTLLIGLSISFIVTIQYFGSKGLYFAQLYMLIPAISAIITRLFFYEHKFSDAYLRLGKWRHWFQFWIISVVLAGLSYVLFSLFNAVTWDLSGQTFLENLEKQFQQSGKTMEETLPPGFTPQTMMLLYVIGNFTVFNILPGLITGMGEELGHRGLMFTWIAEKNIRAAIVFGGIFWFLWHLPLALIMPVKQNLSTLENIVNVILLIAGSICTHIYLAFVLLKTRSIWITALAHITFNNVSTALGFFVAIQHQTLANLGLVLTMLISVIIGFWKFSFWSVLQTAQKLE